MAKYWCYFLFLLWLSYMILSSVLLFTKGFLLSRETLKHNASCITPVEKEEIFMDNINTAVETCLPQKTKVVLLIIDALRYDFVTYDKDLKVPLPFQNKLPVVNKLLNEHPSSSRLYKFIADPPTTTMQRLNALTTGSLPTFIDAGSNFATAEINEDNIIDQLTKHDYNVVFMGDDTWMGLYPNRFVRSYPYPSFNVRDLDTVDNGVIDNLYPELKGGNFSLLIGHFLGVDHCGHRYGPYHSEMSRKLNEMNEVIENVVEMMDDSTVLIVIGDHGMTETGDHGGGSENEISSALFVYTPLPLKTISTVDTVKQVDLVPTLAAIFGVPIPYSNLGTLIVDSVPVSNNLGWKQLLFLLWSNVQQLVRYIRQYSESSPIFNEDELNELYNKFAVLNARVHGVKDEAEFKDFFEECISFMVSLREMCEQVWIQFDSFSMSRGLLLLFLSVFFVYMIVDGIPSNRLPEIFMSTFLLCSYTALALSAGLSFVLYYFEFVDNLLLNIYFSTGIASLFMLVVLVIQNWEVIALHWYDKSKKNKIPNLILRLVLICSIGGVFSNSYIVEECYVSEFLLITLVYISCFGLSYKPTNKKVLLLVFAVCVLSRVSMYFWRCREEQQWCLMSDSFVSVKNSLETARTEWTITLISLALLVTITRIWLRSCGNLVGYSYPVIMARYAPTVIVVCTGGFWVLQRLPKEMKSKLLPSGQPELLAWVVYLLVFLGMLSILIKPLCLYVVPKNVDASKQNAIPYIFKQLRSLFQSQAQEKDDVPIVCGLATVYSAVYLIFGVYFCLLWALLLGDVVAPSSAVAFITVCLFVVATSIARMQKISSTDQLFEVPASNILTFVILSQHFFYASGHQPTFPNIAWEAAFVGTSGIFTHNFIPASLIIINTYGSYILTGFLLPLIVIAPFSLFVMTPSVIPKKMEKDLSRGEILLYEKSGLFLKSVFILCCKYVMCFGIKVFAAMLSSTIHCRHLMVWKIFAPKLIFESIGILVTLATVLFSYLLLIHIHHKVDSLVYRLNKQYR